MPVRVATVLDIAEMHMVRTSVRENTLPDYSVLTPEMYEDHITRLGRGWVFEQNGQIVGIALANLEEALVWALFVRPDFEKRGIGRCLHDVMLEWFSDHCVPKVALDTDPNSRAAGFYKAAGWVSKGLDERGQLIFEKTLS